MVWAQPVALGTAESTNTPPAWLVHDQRQSDDHTIPITTGKRGIVDVCSPGQGECKRLSDGSECRTEGWEAQDRVYWQDCVCPEPGKCLSHQKGGLMGGPPGYRLQTRDKTAVTHEQLRGLALVE